MYYLIIMLSLEINHHLKHITQKVEKMSDFERAKTQWIQIIMCIDNFLFGFFLPGIPLSDKKSPLVFNFLIFSAQRLEMPLFK